LQIIFYQRSLNYSDNQSDVKSISGKKLSYLFSLIVDNGFDNFNHHFPALFSPVDMNTILDPQKPCNTFLHIAANRGHTHFLQYLLAHGAKVDAVDAGLFQGYGLSLWLHGWLPHWGHTPLVYAAGSGATDCVAALIAARANINFKSLSSGTTALHKAAVEGHAECIKKLLTAGANTHITNKEGRQAFEVAKDSLCRALLEEKMRQRGERTQSSHCLLM
jgi:Ankyrin repeats (3 copies)